MRTAQELNEDELNERLNIVLGTTLIDYLSDIEAFKLIVEYKMDAVRAKFADNWTVTIYTGRRYRTKNYFTAWDKSLNLAVARALCMVELEDNEEN